MTFNFWFSYGHIHSARISSIRPSLLLCVVPGIESRALWCQASIFIPYDLFLVTCIETTGANWASSFRRSSHRSSAPHRSGLHTSVLPTEVYTAPTRLQYPSDARLMSGVWTVKQTCARLSFATGSVGLQIRLLLITIPRGRCLSLCPSYTWANPCANKVNSLVKDVWMGVYGWAHKPKQSGSQVHFWFSSS